MNGYGPGAQPKRGISGTLYDRYQALLSGRMKPWELPEFKGMESRLQRIGALNRQGMGRQLTAAGVRGPALGMALEKGRETEMAPMGAAITRAYQQIPGQAMAVQSQEDAMYNAMQDRFLQGLLARMGIHSQERIAKRGQQSQAATGWMQGLCILATACYGLDSAEVEFMRFYRDKIIPRKIIRGYYVFSDVVSPLMKFKIVKRFVKSFIVDSLIGAGLRWIGWKPFRLRLPLDLAVTTALLKFWKILGSRGPYRRRNGEIY